MISLKQWKFYYKEASHFELLLVENAFFVELLDFKQESISFNYERLGNTNHLTGVNNVDSCIAVIEDNEKNHEIIQILKNEIIDPETDKYRDNQVNSKKQCFIYAIIDGKRTELAFYEGFKLNHNRISSDKNNLVLEFTYEKYYDKEKLGG